MIWFQLVQRNLGKIILLYDKSEHVDSVSYRANFWWIGSFLLRESGEILKLRERFNFLLDSFWDPDRLKEEEQQKTTTALPASKYKNTEI